MDKTAIRHLIEKTAIVGPAGEIFAFGLPSYAGYEMGRGTGAEIAAGGREDNSKIDKLFRYALIPGYTGYEMGKRRGIKEYKRLNKTEKKAAYVSLPSNRNVPAEPIKGEMLDEYIDRGSRNLEMLDRPIKQKYNAIAKERAIEGLISGGLLGAGLGAAFPFGNKGRAASALISGAVTAPIFAAADASRPLVKKRRILNKREEGLKEYQDALLAGERNLYKV